MSAASVGRACALLIVALLVSSSSAAVAQTKSSFELELSGVINPPKARWIKGALERAAHENAALVLITIDTPGGLVTSMQEICAAISNAPVPVVGFVGPRSAQATSAGAFVLLATDVAAMAPGTRVGAAHPVSSGEKLDAVMDAKATNSLSSLSRSLAERRGRPADWAESMVRESKSYTEDQALGVHGIELVATDRDELLRRLDGFRIARDPGRPPLSTKSLTRVSLSMPWHWKLVDALADPTLATLLLSFGMMAILYELSSPGIGMGGIVGVICMLLGLLGVSALPLGLGGIALVVAGLVAIGVEIKAQTHGMLAAGGIAALVIGAMFLVDPGDYFGAIQRVNWRLFAPVVSVLVVLLVLLARTARRALGAAPRSGVEGLLGRRGRAKATFVARGTDFSGSVFVDGARWEAVSKSAISEGDEIEVTRVLSSPTRLEVTRAPS